MIAPQVNGRFPYLAVRLTQQVLTLIVGIVADVILNFWIAITTLAIEFTMHTGPAIPHLDFRSSSG